MPDNFSRYEPILHPLSLLGLFVSFPTKALLNPPQSILDEVGLH
jgi:hypothetical protein